jgi:hypothetical protein
VRKAMKKVYQHCYNIRKVKGKLRRIMFLWDSMIFFYWTIFYNWQTHQKKSQNIWYMFLYTRNIIRIWLWSLWHRARSVNRNPKYVFVIYGRLSFSIVNVIRDEIDMRILYGSYYCYNTILLRRDWPLHRTGPT